MPSIEALLAFTLAAFVLIVVPGPNLIYILTRGVEQGRQAAVASALGVETGSLFHIAAAAVGLSALLASSALAFNVIRYLGAAYLIYLGVRTLVHRGAAPEVDRSSHAPRLALVYRQAVVVNLLNPKVALFFLAFLPQFVDPSRGAVPAQILVLGLVFLLVGFCVDMVYALAAGTLGDWLRRSAFRRWQRYVAGSTYVALGSIAALVGPDHTR